MDSLAWLRRADAGSANLKGDMLPAAIGKANAPASKTSDSKFDSLRGKMAAYFIAPGNLALLNELGNVCEPFLWEVRFLLGMERGIKALAKPIFVRAQPFNSRHASCLAGASCAFIGNGKGIEALAKPIFVRAQPFNGSGTAALAPHPKSLRQIGEAGVFSERTLEVLTNLSCWRFVFYSITDNGIDSLLSPLRGTPTVYLNAPLACFLAYVEYASPRRFAYAPFLAPKSLRQIGNPWFFRTNSGSVYEPLLWEVRFLLGGGRGIEALAKPIFVRGYAPSMAGMPRARPVSCIVF